MANGFPLAAVVGHRDLMDAARKTWISSTLASESSALAAAGAVLDWHDSADVCAVALVDRRRDAPRREPRDRSERGAGSHGRRHRPDVDVAVRPPERERRFLELRRGNGVLFKRGAYNFAALAHDDDALRDLERGASGTLVALRDEEAEADG